MSSYQIFTDATADLTPELTRELGVSVIPMDYTADGVTRSYFPGNPDFDCSDFYGLLRAGKSCSTTQVNAAAYADHFAPVLESGKDIVYLCFSSALSGTFQSATIASEDLKARFPERRVAVVDTRCASLGEGLLVWHAVQKQKSGMELEELLAYTQEIIPHLCQLFTVDDLNHLKRGGRVSAAAALVGGMLGVKPMLNVSNEGKLEPISKVRGRKASLSFLVNRMEQNAISPEEQTVFIGHGDALSDAEFVAQEISRKMNPKEIVIGPIGPVIGSHSGPGTIALFFIGKER